MEVDGVELRLEVDGSTDACAWFHQAEVASLPRAELVDGALVALRG
jgi:hypothetical protein